MVRRILVSLVWGVIAYYTAVIGTAAIAGGQAGAKDPEHAAEAGARAGEASVRAMAGYYLAGAVCLVLLGSATGCLPGCGSRRPRDED